MSIDAVVPVYIVFPPFFQADCSSGGHATLRFELSWSGG